MALEELLKNYLEEFLNQNPSTSILSHMHFKNPMNRLKEKPDFFWFLGSDKENLIDMKLNIMEKYNMKV